MERSAGLLLRRLVAALCLAASLAFGLGPAATLAVEFRPGDESCVTAAEGPGAVAADHHPGRHQAPCCGMLCVPALPASVPAVGPPASAAIAPPYPLVTAGAGIDLDRPTPPPR